MCKSTDLDWLLRASLVHPAFIMATNGRKTQSKDFDSEYDTIWSWKITLGTFIVLFIVMAFVRNEGIFLKAIQEDTGASTSKVAWISASFRICLQILTLLGCVLAVRFGFRPVVMTGGLMMALGLILSVAYRSVIWYIATLGILAGVGAALCLIPSVVVLASHFKRRIGLATSVAYAGSCIGHMILAPTLTYLVDYYGIEGALMIMAAVTLHIVLAGVLFHPAPTPKAPIDSGNDIEMTCNPLITENGQSSPEHDICSSHKSLDERKTCRPTPKAPVDSSDEIETAVNPLLPEPVQSSPVQDVCYSHKSLDQRDTWCNCCTRLSSGGKTKETKPGPKTQMNLLRKLLNRPTFYVIAIFFSCGTIEYSAGFKYIPMMAAELGISDESVAFAFSIGAGTDLVGRIVNGFVMDSRIVIHYVKRYRVTATAGMVMAINSFVISYNHNHIVFYVCIVVHATASGIFFASRSIATQDILGDDLYLLGFGMTDMCAVVLGPVDSLVLGYIGDQKGSFKWTFIVVGSIGVFASLTFFSLQCLGETKCHKKTSTAESHDVVV